MNALIIWPASASVAKVAFSKTKLSVAVWYVSRTSSSSFVKILWLAFVLFASVAFKTNLSLVE